MSEKRVPDFLIEQYVLGELPPEKAREVERSERFTERVAEVERDTERFLEAHPPHAFAQRIRNAGEAAERSPVRSPARTRAGAGRTIRLLTFAVPGAAAVLALAFVLFGGLGIDTVPVVDPDSQILRIKGAEPRISVYRSTGTEDAEALADGDVARQGDELQITYTASGRGFGAIVSVDGRGTVTLHYPLTPSSEPALTTGGEQRLPYAYRLDDAPAFERFYFVTSRSSFEVSELLTRIRSQADSIVSSPDIELRLPGDFEVEAITIRKGA
ncbi:MAG: hypothetical protein ACOCW3_01045 [Spirochaetota bacterium]